MKKDYKKYYVYEIYTDFNDELDDYSFYDITEIYNSKNKKDCYELRDFLNEQIKGINDYDDGISQYYIVKNKKMS
jgi:hypothetical protein